MPRRAKPPLQVLGLRTLALQLLRHAPPRLLLLLSSVAVQGFKLGHQPQPLTP
eukprot:CAMPEP_0203880438 /NCGR_PEP_ID=MMETSP0359-20131031/24837_1 /ASSEMBLY_ACC=CAM_ASM_000338 /TAXON_ID=268821 /ORGANISM="Scrippsiella Hangoei, Strain SHTV-5" /LENGTH=52 /DNA_ID=CAMNT_0050800059 /DNA_START=15 /DNA_END=173 /DNA_ORIENTATION=+